MDKLASDIYAILSEEFGVPVGQISDRLGPGDLPKWDSIGQIKLISRFEEEFRLQFTTGDIMSINSVRDIVRLIKKLAPKETLKEAAAPRKKGAAGRVATSPLRLPKTTYWGEGSLSALEGIRQSKVAVVTGSSPYATKINREVARLLSGKRTVSQFQKPPGETTEEGVRSLAAALRRFSPEAILAVGGGSCIDLAKLGWALYEHPDTTLEEIALPFRLAPLRGKSAFIAVPTTFGTGAEVSSAATFSRKGSIGKTVVVSHEFIPDQVILDPTLGKGLPLPVLYASAFDALTHAIEGSVSAVKNPLVEPYAVWAVKAILSALKPVKKEGASDKTLGLLCAAAYYAGIVQNHCSVGLTHAFAHQLGGLGIAHGRANALFLEVVMAFNATKTDRYLSLAAACGFSSLKGLTASIHRILGESNLSPDAAILKKIKQQRSPIIEGAMRDITFKTNPVALSREEVGAVFDNFLRRWNR